MSKTIARNKATIAAYPRNRTNARALSRDL
jgi:hypothetical protein